MVEVEVTSERFGDLIFVQPRGWRDDEIAFCIDTFCRDREHGHWLREQAPNFEVTTKHRPRRYYIVFDDMNTALLYKLTWGRG